MKISRPSHRRRFQGIAALATLWIGSGLAWGAKPNIRLVAQSNDEFVSDTKTKRDLARSADERAIPNGNRVLLVTKAADKTTAALVDGSGRTSWEGTLPAGVTVYSFGPTIVHHESFDHSPGFPYLLQLLTPQGKRELRRDGRTIAQVKTLDEHMAVTSYQGPSPASETELFDSRGQKLALFVDADGSIPRVVSSRTFAVAVFPKLPDSRVQVFDLVRSQSWSLSVPGVSIDNAALLSDGSGVLVWGPHAAALLSADGRSVSWQTAMPGDLRLLRNLTSSAGVLKDSIALAGCQPADGGKCQMAVALVDRETGSLRDVETLAGEAAFTTFVRRFPGDAAERIALTNRVYELTEGR